MQRGCGTRSLLGALGAVLGQNRLTLHRWVWMAEQRPYLQGPPRVFPGSEKTQRPCPRPVPDPGTGAER